MLLSETWLKSDDTLEIQNFLSFEIAITIRKNVTFYENMYLHNIFLDSTAD